ncbi:phosphoadenosine phosphosulfate reductase family protein [Mesorhizobium sp.]|uniref:phosphoadenosine phosphosulfate reductase domain-containing protein n=1 Tax=Mesorhizobium sp. TaxID=1871066 RepID=UPI000FE89147|nr:phosphoadenosine phosphosulfate reductase family protein [Mesorhizobium sp.]RWO22839.1 MAG: hypothetical protein EOS09_19415 [Mesorhizobium sp.]
MSKLLISFSGGETSALMAKLIVERMANEYDAVQCVFANTGQENEQTLNFVQRCNEAFGLGVVWVEAEVNPERGEGTGATVVGHNSADRVGRVFEAVIDKYGIPNQGYPHCTRELKGNPIRAYLRSIGWQVGSYDTAIGIRTDEIDRISPTAKQQRLLYPLVSRFPRSKPMVNAFWEKQPFRLELKGYQGNCKWCWKKSLRKHLTIISETPEAYDFPERMEREKADCGAGDASRVFFREHRSVADLRRLAATTKFRPASDDARQYQPGLFDLEMDAANGCEESCEVEFGEAA